MLKDLEELKHNIERTITHKIDDEFERGWNKCAKFCLAELQYLIDKMEVRNGS